MKISSLHWGPENGDPVLFFHGFPGSAVDGGILANVAETKGLRVSAFDRPGYAETDIRYRDDMDLFFKNILENFDSQRKLTVIGLSGGGPYATEFSFRYPERVKKMVLICAVAGLKNPSVLKSFPRSIQKLLRLFPKVPLPMRRLLVRTAKKIRGQPEKFMRRFVERLPQIDQDVFKSELVFQGMCMSNERAGRQGLLGAEADLHFYLNWEPPMVEVRPPFSVSIYHGTQDTIVPFSSFELYGRCFPWAHKQSSNDGHISLPVLHSHEFI